MFDKWQCCLFTVLIVVTLATLVDNRSYNNGLIFYDPQAHNVFLPPTVSVSRGRSLASVKYSSKGSIWSTFGKPCDCSGVICGCCAGVRVKQFDFDQKMCANVTFLAEKHEAILDVYLNKVPSARYGISARNPSPICIPIMLPIPMAMCVQMSDIAIKGNNLHMCMDFVVRLVTTDFFEMHFQCMQMGLDGVQYLDKNGKPVLPIGSKTQIIFNQNHSQEDNQYDDEISLNENEVDSNENKVEQNDYKEQEEEEENVENEEAPNDTDEILNTVAVEAIDIEKEKADEDADDENTKNIKDDDADAQSDFIAESVTNMQNLTTNEIAHEKLDGNATFAAMQAHDMHKLENLLYAATISPMVTTTTTSTTTSTTTATNTAGNNVENVDAVTDKANDADANEYNDNGEHDGEEQSEDEDGDNDDDDDDESENEDSDEEDEDDDDDDYEDENNNEQDVADDVGDDVSNNNENDSNAIATKIITEFSTSYAQPQLDAERISVAAATVANQAASITLPFVAASETSPGAEKTSSKRHLKLLNYRRARG